MQNECGTTPGQVWKDDGGTIILFLVLLYEIRGLNTWDRGTFRSQMSHEQGNETSESGSRVVLDPPHKMEPTEVMGLIHLYGKNEDASRSRAN